jgi:hypothetical protein
MFLSKIFFLLQLALNSSVYSANYVGFGVHPMHIDNY